MLLSCDGKRPNNGKSASGNAFSVLMSSFKENEVWREASMAEHKTSFPQKSNGGRRKAPFYKVLQGMPVAVDAFKYGAIPKVTAYFLTSVSHFQLFFLVTLTNDFPLTDMHIPIIIRTYPPPGSMDLYIVPKGPRTLSSICFPLTGNGSTLYQWTPRR